MSSVTTKQIAQSVGSAGLLLLLLTSSAWAGDVTHSGRPGGPRAQSQLMQDLNLSKEQHQQLKTIRDKNINEAHMLQSQIRQKHQGLSQYLASPNADKGKAIALQRDLAHDQNRLRELRMDAWFEMKTVLTPEQLQTMRVKRQQMAQRPNGNRKARSPQRQQGF